MLEFEGVLDPGGSHVVAGIALAADGTIVTVDSHTRLLSEFDSYGTKLREFGYGIDGEYVLGFPVEVQADGPHVLVSDRDPDAPALVWFSAKSGRYLRRLPLWTTPGARRIGSGHFLVGDWDFAEDRKNRLLHVIRSDGSVTRSFLPMHERAQFTTVFGQAGANDVCFDVDARGRVWASQAFDQSLIRFNSVGEEETRIADPCAMRRPLQFEVFESREQWRDSWTRPVKLRVVDSVILWQTIDKIGGPPGYLNVFDMDGRVLGACVPAPGWLEAASGPRFLLSRREGEENKWLYRYWIYRLRSADRVPALRSAQRIAAATRTGSGASTQRPVQVKYQKPIDERALPMPEALRPLLGQQASLVVLLNNDACPVCMQETKLLRRLDESCPGMTTSFVDLDPCPSDVRARLEAAIDEPLALCDDSGSIRAWASTLTEQPSTPFKILIVSGKPQVVWNSSMIYMEQSAINAEILDAAGCSPGHRH